jgi:glycosyltransferase involved in cell wall biosynthesis
MDGSMKIALLAASWGNRGGIERHCAVLAHALQQDGWTTRLLIPETKKSASLLDWWRHQDVQAETCPAFKTVHARHSLASMRQLRQCLEQDKPDVVSFHYRDVFPLTDVLAAHLAGIEMCLVSLPCVPHFSWKRRWAIKLIAPFVDRFIVHSLLVADRLVKMGIPASKVVSFAYGLRPPVTHPPRAQARQRLGIPAEAFVVGTHARLNYEKGIDCVIQAMARVAPAAPTLLIAGTGPEHEHLEDLADRLGVQVQFLGQLDGSALGDFYAALDVFTLAPRWDEAFGLVFIEAAQQGAPSVSWQVGGVQQAIVDDRTGLLAEGGNLAGLATRIAWLQHSPGLREELGQAARIRAVYEFTAWQMSQRFAAAVMRPFKEKENWPRPS